MGGKSDAVNHWGQKPGEAAACWMRMPTGCNKGLGETQAPQSWFIDPQGSTSATCPSRVGAFNSYCGKSDAVNHWGQKPGEACAYFAYEASSGSCAQYTAAGCPDNGSFGSYKAYKLQSLVKSPNRLLREASTMFLV